MRQPGRRHQGQPAAIRSQPRQRRQEQRQFTDAAAVNQKFGQISARPATTRQFLVQFRMPAGNALTGQARQRIATPDIAAGQNIGQGDIINGKGR